MHNPEITSREGKAAGDAAPLLARISHQLSTVEAHPGMSTALRSVGLLDVLSSAPAEPSVARLVFMPVRADSHEIWREVQARRFLTRFATETS
jgi:hypothetical protein